MNDLAPEIDCRGARCPQSVIRLARAARDLTAGAVLSVAADDPAAATDVPAWCRMRGHELVRVDEAPDGVPVYVVRLGAG